MPLICFSILPMCCGQSMAVTVSLIKVLQVVIPWHFQSISKIFTRKNILPGGATNGLNQFFHKKH